MPDFKALGYDKSVTLYIKVPGTKYVEETYTAVLLNNCQVVTDHKQNINKIGADNASKVSVNFMCADNADVEITDSMLNNSFFVVGDTTEVVIGSNFYSYMQKHYADCYMLSSFNYEGALLQHYELGGA